MEDHYSQAAADLLKRVASRSKSQTAAPESAATQIGHLVINRPQHCTFIVGAVPPVAPAQPPACNEHKTKGA